MIKVSNAYIQTLKPTIWVGKNGLTGDIIDEIKHQLNARKVIKIKYLKSCDLDISSIQGVLVGNADVIDIRGKIAVLSAKNHCNQENIGKNNQSRKLKLEYNIRSRRQYHPKNRK
ncbi:MAG TPA: YhbY family RNA-binding protein [Methanocorpusculum sp.]|nr:YhbY family RNA-binding protein [Methanocorpusculum sp.]